MWMCSWTQKAEVFTGLCTSSQLHSFLNNAQKSPVVIFGHRSSALCVVPHSITLRATVWLKWVNVKVFPTYNWCISSQSNTRGSSKICWLKKTQNYFQGQFTRMTRNISFHPLAISYTPQGLQPIPADVFLITSSGVLCFICRRFGDINLWDFLDFICWANSIKNPHI